MSREAFNLSVTDVYWQDAEISRVGSHDEAKSPWIKSDELDLAILAQISGVKVDLSHIFRAYDLEVLDERSFSTFLLESLATSKSYHVLVGLLLLIVDIVKRAICHSFTSFCFWVRLMNELVRW